MGPGTLHQPGFGSEKVSTCAHDGGMNEWIDGWVENRPQPPLFHLVTSFLDPCPCVLTGPCPLLPGGSLVTHSLVKSSLGAPCKYQGLSKPQSSTQFLPLLAPPHLTYSSLYPLGPHIPMPRICFLPLPLDDSSLRFKPLGPARKPTLTSLQLPHSLSVTPLNTL